MSVLQALVDQYERLSMEGRAPDYGYSSEGVSYMVVLSAIGDVVGVMDIRDTMGKSPRPRRIFVPTPPPDRTSKVVANFLWDKSAYSFGVARDKSTNEPTLSKRGEYDAFKNFHLDLLSATNDKGLLALVAFLRSWKPNLKRFLRLTHAQDMLGANIVFRLDGEQGYIHARAAGRRIWHDHLAAQGGTDALCLVTGERAPIRRLHPKIKGVGGAQSSGASIVSFNEGAFESFGKKQGANAPVSERAAFAYTTALNAMLPDNSGHSIHIRDTAVVFWAEAKLGQAAALAAENIFSIIEGASPTDEEESAQIRDKLVAISEGRPIREVHPDVQEETCFFVLGIAAPSKSRLSIRFWCEDQIGTIYRRVAEHWKDLRILPTDEWARFPSARDLANETARVIRKKNGKIEKDFKTVSPLLAGGLVKAILTGQPYPRTLVSSIVMRIRSDQHITSLRIAILKACLVRDLRFKKQRPLKEDYLVSLDTSSADTAYNLGRLFAAFVYAESSRAERNSTIRDKYMGAASSTPRRAFPILMRGYEHNRSHLAKADDKRHGYGVRADKAVREIVELLPGGNDLPATLPLEDQSRFFIGYYHQERAFYVPSNDTDRRSQTEE